MATKTYTSQSTQVEFGLLRNLAREVNWTGRVQIKTKTLVVPPKPVRDNREQFVHDVANLVLLPVLLGANFVALQDERTLQTSMLTLSCFVLYFLADVCWIALHPASVPQQRVVITHHALLSLLILRVLLGEHRGNSQEQRRISLHWMLAGEVSTWFLVARRNTPFARSLTSVLFFLSWVYRVVVYVDQWFNCYRYLTDVSFAILDSNGNGQLQMPEFLRAWNWVRLFSTYESADLGLLTSSLILMALWTYDLAFAKAKEECACEHRHIQ